MKCCPADRNFLSDSCFDSWVGQRRQNQQAASTNSFKEYNASIKNKTSSQEHPKSSLVANWHDYALQGTSAALLLVMSWTATVFEASFRQIWAQGFLLWNMLAKHVRPFEWFGSTNKTYVNTAASSEMFFQDEIVCLIWTTSWVCSCSMLDFSSSPRFRTISQVFCPAQVGITQFTSLEPCRNCWQKEESHQGVDRWYWNSKVPTYTAQCFASGGLQKSFQPVASLFSQRPAKIFPCWNRSFPARPSRALRCIVFGVVVELGAPRIFVAHRRDHIWTDLATFEAVYGGLAHFTPPAVPTHWTALLICCWMGRCCRCWAGLNISWECLTYFIAKIHAP